MAGPAHTHTVFRHSPSEVVPTIAIVVSRFHREVTTRLRDGALAAFSARFPGVAHMTDGSSQVHPPTVVEVPGAFEIPHMCAFIMGYSRFSAVVALGCIVRGQTSHDRVLADAVTGSLARLTVDIPVGLGVLTVDTLEQAMERSGGSEGNKGADAMNAVLDCASEKQRLIRELGTPDLIDDFDYESFDDLDPDEPLVLSPPKPARFKNRPKESR